MPSLSSLSERYKRYSVNIIHHIDFIFQKPSDIPISSHIMSESEVRQRRGKKEVEDSQNADEMEDEKGGDTDKKGDAGVVRQILAS